MARRETSRRGGAYPSPAPAGCSSTASTSPTWTSTWYRCSASSPGRSLRGSAAPGASRAPSGAAHRFPGRRGARRQRSKRSRAGLRREDCAARPSPGDRLADLLPRTRQGFDLRVRRSSASPSCACRRAPPAAALLPHLILDGWSTAALLKEVLTAYAALTRHAPELPPRRPSRLTCLAGGPDPASRDLLARRLQVSRHPPARRHGRRRRPAATASAGWRCVLGNSGLGAFARRHRLTQAPGTRLGLLLACMPRARRGLRTTVAGRRRAARRRVDARLLIKHPPVRLATDPAEPLLPWLAALQADSRDAPVRAQRARRGPGWSECRGSGALRQHRDLETTRSTVASRRRGELDVSTSARWNDHYPLSLTALPDTLELQVLRPAPLDAATATACSPPRTLLAGMAASGEAAGRRLADLSPSPRPKQQICHEWNDSRARARPTSASTRFAANARARDRTAVVEPGRSGTSVTASSTAANTRHRSPRWASGRSPVGSLERRLEIAPPAY